MRDVSLDELTRLWRAACAGERQSLEKLLRALQDPIYRYCLTQLKQEAQAVDATQETAIRVIKDLRKFNQSCRLTSWVLGYARNVCLELIRKQRKYHQPETDLVATSIGVAEEYGKLEQMAATHHDVHQEIQQQERVAQLRNQVRRLPQRQREAISLKYFEMLSMAEIAQVMGVKIGTVKATLSAGLDNLRLQLQASNE